MARYISLIRFTDQGARSMKKSAARAASFRKSAERAGITVEAQLWTMGAYDGLLILSGDETKILHCLAGLVESGNVRTETMLAVEGTAFKALAG